jgi:hypothetical protein
LPVGADRAAIRDVELFECPIRRPGVVGPMTGPDAISTVRSRRAWREARSAPYTHRAPRSTDRGPELNLPPTVVIDEPRGSFGEAKFNELGFIEFDSGVGVSV